MKCEECGERCKATFCFPDRRGLGWRVFYCETKHCHMAQLLIPQTPRQKAINMLAINTARDRRAEDEARIAGLGIALASPEMRSRVRGYYR